MLSRCHDTALPIALLFLNSEAVCYRELWQLSKPVVPVHYPDWLLCHRLFLDSLSTCYSGIYPQAHPHLLHPDPTRLVSARQPASHVDCFRIDPSPQATGDRQAPQSNHTCDSSTSKSLCGLECWVPESQRQILTQGVSLMIQLPSVRTLLLEDSTRVL